jgi:hypothetical protein
MGGWCVRGFEEVGTYWWMVAKDRESWRKVVGSRGLYWAVVLIVMIIYVID